MVGPFPNEQKSVSVTKSRLGSVNNDSFQIFFTLATAYDYEQEEILIQ